MTTNPPTHPRFKLQCRRERAGQLESAIATVASLVVLAAQRGLVNGRI